MVGNQRMKVGKAHVGKIVTVVIEDTCFRVRHGEEELAVRPRNDTTPITKVKVYARHSRPTAEPSKHLLRRRAVGQRNSWERSVKHVLNPYKTLLLLEVGDLPLQLVDVGGRRAQRPA